MKTLLRSLSPSCAGTPVRRWHRVLPRLGLLIVLTACGTAHAATVSGTVFEDTDGDVLGGGPGIAGRTVRLYNSAGTQILTTATLAGGSYSFAAVVDGAYYVAVDAPTATASGTAGVLGEQTFASAGTGNGGTIGTNFGPLCVTGTPPTYTDQGGATTTNTSVDNSATNACYGGRRGGTADGGAAAINSKEHVTRINVASNNDVASVDFGFSFNVVTNINDAGQGSLRQFLANANAINGANGMRFVPAVATNAAGGGGNWWRVVLASNLAAIAPGNGAGTTIEGTAYSRVDGATVLDTNAGDLRAAVSVGYLTDQATIPAMAKPELQINRNAVSTASWVFPVLHVQAANTTVRNVSITSGTESILVNSGGATNLLVEDNALGLAPDGAMGWPSTWNGGSDGGTNVSVTNVTTGNCTALTSTGTINHNVMVAPASNVRLCGNGVSYSITSNISADATGHALGTVGTGLGIWGGALSAPATCVSNSTAINNLIETRTIFWPQCGSDNQIIGNTITGGNFITTVFVTDATGLLVRGNAISNTNSGSPPPNAGSGVLVRGASQRVQVTRNSFSNNAGNAIDLNFNGVTIATATGADCPSSGVTNGGIPRPRLTKAAVAATTLTVSGNYCNTGTYRIEFYKVAAGSAGDIGSDTLQAGEGQVYLGELTGQSGGTFTNVPLTIPAATLAIGDNVTALAIREDGAATAGNTSEFSVNAAVGVDVSGRVFQDTVGDLLSDGAVGSAGNPGIAGRTVRLFNSAGTQLQTATTAADGSYSFASVVNGVHYVAVDAPIVDAAATAGVLGEQTYASAGTGNSGTAGTHFGSLCVMGTPPTYTDQGATTTTNTPVDNSANGACYGGRRGSVADSGTTTINTKEHVVRINVLDASVASVDFGFSFNVVTNVNDAGQGALRQFILNGNAIAGANAMRFVPAVVTNTASGGSWWRIPLASNLPAITAGNGAGTRIEGVAYSKADGSTVLDTNPGDLRPPTVVGYLTDQATIPALARPELQIDRGGTGSATWQFPVIYIQAADVAVRNTSITFGTESITVNTSGVTNLLIEHNALGVTPAGVIARPSALAGSDAGTNVWVRASASGLSCGALTGNGTVSHNILASPAANVHLCGNVSYTMTLNHSIQGTGFTTWGNTIGFPVDCSSSNSLINNHSVSTYLVWAYCGSNNQVIGNTGTGSLIETWDATGLTVRGNVITNTLFGAAVRIRGSNASAGQRVEVSRNSFSANAGNAIDLNWNGVTTVTATGGNCPSSGIANGGSPRPRITSALLSGTTLTVSGNYCNTGTYRLEFYKVAPGNTGDVGADTLQAGEGQIYLGALSGQTGGTFTNSTVAIPASTLANGDSITAIAIREDGATTAGNTSEFSANALLAVSVSGRVFQDSVGDLLADGAVGSAGNPALAGRTVRLFNSAGTQLQTATTAADGSYSFAGVLNGVHYIAVDAPITDAAGTAGVLGELTYASAGTGNGGTAGTNFGALCVMGTPPTYNDQGAATTTNTPVDNSANGACYGGRRGSVADSGTTTINTKEHVVRINVLDTGVTAVDFGFSFNVVTNVNDAGQGSLRQLIANANAIAGANAMRFVPAVATNAGSWWRITLGSLLPAISGANGASTTVDGTAYSKSDGTTVYDANPGTLMPATPVGTGADQATIPALDRPELEVFRASSAAFADASNAVFEVAASNVALRKMSVTGGTESVIMRTAGVTGLLIQDNALGTDPSGAPSLPVANLGNGGNIKVGVTTTCPGLAGTRGMIDHNLMRSEAAGVALCNLTGNSLGDWVVQGNFALQSARVLLQPGAFYGGVASATANTTVRNNYLTGAATAGISFITPNTGGGHQILGNTITGNGGRGISIVNTPGNVLVRGNVISNNGLAGVSVAPAATTVKNLITENSFIGNAGNAIDLGANGVTIVTATGGNCPSSGLANGGIPRPRITSATASGTTTLNVSGNYCNTGTYRLEFYKVAAGNTGDVGSDSLQAGEGETFLGALTGQTGGTFTNAALAISSGSIAVGNSITAIAIREDGGATAGNTSEFSANAVVTLQLPRITLTKTSVGSVGTFVFNGEGANANGFPTNSSYSLTTTAPNTPITGTQVSLAAANVITDIKETLPAGWVMSSVTCTDANAAGSGNPTGTLTPQIVNGNTIRIAAENAKLGADLRCTVTNSQAGFTLAGLVILDDGNGGGTAHDAIQNGTEAGRTNVTVRLTNCGPTTYSTATTDAAGAFSLSLSGVPAGQVCLVKTPSAGFLPVSANIGNTVDGVYNRTTDTLTFTLAVNTNYTGVVLGEVTQSRLTTDGAQQVPAGGQATYAHTFVAGTSAQVTFATSDVATPAVPGWTSLLYRDANCDALLDGGDALVSNPIAVTAGQTVCLLNRVTSPAGATDGMSNVTTVSASEVFSLIALTIPHARTDTTTVGKAGLTLIKQVRRITACPANAAASLADVTPWTTSNTALPGQLLEYRIVYRNDTPAPVTQVKVHDTVPAYTQFKSAQCLETPATGLTGCSVTSAPAVNATSGAVEWTLTDSAGPLVGLQPGATGSVGYCQQVMP